MPGQHLAHPHLLQEHQLGQVLLSVDYHSVLAEVLGDVLLPGL